MPIIKHLIKGHKNPEAVINVVNYISNSSFLAECGWMGIFIPTTEGIYNEFSTVKNIMGKQEGKQIHHMIIGFEKHKGWYLSAVTEIARKMAVQISTRFQVFYGVHMGTLDDPEYLHIHMAINTVSYVDGNRFYESNSHFGEINGFLQAAVEESFIPDCPCTWCQEECVWEDENREYAFF